MDNYIAKRQNWLLIRAKFAYINAEALVHEFVFILAWVDNQKYCDLSLNCGA